ncbi:CDP-glycerol glycerophosphotransferase family protein [uncultured Jatrophihabitans sp.]|uniref:CDP-glycerol glycerophosphotransferase family protein n=1 Tax=uncultured Jatrophihabitans sp. TaxID=1610747 RepID=UPI0035CAE6D2
MTLRARVKAYGVGVLKRNPAMRAQYRTWRTRQRSLLFRWNSRGTPDAGLIAFESFMGRSYAGSPRALYEAMLDDPRYTDCRFVWSFRNPAHAQEFATLGDSRTSVVRYRTAPYYQAFGRAAVWISNSVIAAELNPRPGQTYVQTWHGTPLKRIGIDVVETTETAMNAKFEIDQRYRIEARKITRFLSAAPFTTRCFTSAFGVAPADVDTLFLEAGNPRNDQLTNATDADVKAARERLGIAPDKKVVLYAPTWRDDQHSSKSGYIYEQPLDLDALRVALGEDWIVLFRAHYLVTNSFDLAAHEGFVLDVSGVDEINEVCLASDVLLTDYSSIYFDYALLDQPMIFFMYDLERYESALRGFYLPADSVPGPIVKTQQELVAALLDPCLGAADAAKRRALNAEMSPHDDGRVCERVLGLLREDLNRSRERATASS